ncbi:MAG: hypothetical protein OEM52_01405 [bacterium]|nr:hypothetical protein [bacterium]
MIEDPIIKQVAQIVDSTVIADRLAARIEAFLQVQSSDNSDLKRLERQIADNQLKIDRLFNLVVEAGIDNDTAIPKIRELEADKVRLMKLLQKEEQTATRQVQIPRVAREAVDFMKGFHKYFAKAPIQERKQLIRHFIQSIRVRPEDRQIDAILTKIPTTDPTFLQVVRSSEQELRSTSGSAKSSGGAIFSAVTRLEYYTSISLQELHNFDKRSTGVFLG